MHYFVSASIFALSLSLASPAYAEEASTGDCEFNSQANDRADDMSSLTQQIDCYTKQISHASAKQKEQVDRLLTLVSANSGVAPSKPGGNDIEPAKVSDGLNYASLLTKVKVPKSAAPDVVGAFRFLCGPGQLSYNDPLVYPGQEGASHLHQFFGNLEADHNSTFASLRKSGESTCSSDLNRSAYWVPALLTGDGNVVRPKHVSVYYKRRPSSDPWFAEYKNQPARLPRGLSYIFGWDATRKGERQDNKTTFRCLRDGKAQKGTMSEVLANCEAGSIFYAGIKAPKCWDGENLTAPDYRSHTSYSKRNRMTGRSSCPASHSDVLPAFTLTIAYQIEAGDKPQNWMFASDHMVPEKWREPGYSFHADWFGAWNDEALAAWQDNCIDKMLNCSDGVLGDGTKMTRNAHFPNSKDYDRIVPVPPKP